MRQYLLLLEAALHAPRRLDRTGVGTRGVFGRQIRFDLEAGFPLLTTKRVHMKSIIYELLWFLRGDTNIGYLNDNGVHIWDEWADENGDLGPVYGRQWRSWREVRLLDNTKPEPERGMYALLDKGFQHANDGEQDHGTCVMARGIDQITNVIEGIKKDPFGRRHIVTAWNPAEISDMALPPCHCLFQFYVTTDGRLSCQLYQRSADIFLGVPFNIASYALLTMMVAQVCGLRLGEFVHTFGDLHLYENHIEQAKLQLSREPRLLPRMELNPEVTDIFSFTYADFLLTDYYPHDAIPAPVAV